jgi:hypothetical protein
MPQIELSSTTLSIQTLYRMFRDSDFYVDRRYQRKLVWTLDEKQKLVDSILREFPIPLVLLAKRQDGKFDIIDGLQRLHTVFSFIARQMDGYLICVSCQEPLRRQRMTLGRFLRMKALY